MMEEPGKITVLDVVEIFQGPFRLSEHIFKGQMCPEADACLLKGKLDDLEREVAKSLRAITVESLIKKPL